jgi:hypothetical protein
VQGMMMRGKMDVKLIKRIVPPVCHVRTMFTVTPHPTKSKQQLS